MEWIWKCEYLESINNKQTKNCHFSGLVRFWRRGFFALLGRLVMEENWRGEAIKRHSSIQVNFHSALIGGHSKAWMARASVQMRSPSASRWLQIAAGRRTAGRERGCHCAAWPRGTPWISDPELRWSTISSFSDWNNKSQPFDSALTPTPLLLLLWDKHQAEVSLCSLQVPGGLKVPNRS